MITSLIVMLELPNFGYMTKFTLRFESLDKIILVAIWTEIMTSQPLYQNVYGFVDLIKIPTMFINKTFKGSEKVKRISNYVFKCSLYYAFLGIAKFSDASRTQVMSHVVYVFLDFLW